MRNSVVQIVLAETIEGIFTTIIRIVNVDASVEEQLRRLGDLVVAGPLAEDR